MEILITIGYIAICILLFSLAIAIHEFGHFIVALKLGLNVERFSIGFGPAIWKKTWKGVEYRISWIPLGGYVSIPDVDPEGTKALEGAGDKGIGSRDKGIESSKKEKIPAWKEIAVAVAGPFMNLVLAAILAVILACVPSAKFGELDPVIGGVLPDSPAAAAGFQEGDRVLSMGGQKITTWYEMTTEVQIAGGRTVPVEVERAGKVVTLELKPCETNGVWRMGAKSLPHDVRAAPWMTTRNPIGQLKDDAGGIFRILKALVTPKEAKATSQALGGPVMIAMGIYSSVRTDFWSGLGFLRYLNVNLAILNLLPIPVLDGGLILFAFIALVFRRRIPEKVVTVLSTVFMYALLGLMAILIYRDSLRGVRMFRAAREQPAIEQKVENQNDDTKRDAKPESR